MPRAAFYRHPNRSSSSPPSRGDGRRRGPSWPPSSSETDHRDGYGLSLRHNRGPLITEIAYRLLPRRGNNGDELARWQKNLGTYSKVGCFESKVVSVFFHRDRFFFHSWRARRFSRHFRSVRSAVYRRSYNILRLCGGCFYLFFNENCLCEMKQIRTMDVLNVNF